MADEKLIVDEAYRKKLEAKYRPIEIDSVFKYVPKDFRPLPVEERPVFYLKRLDGLTVVRSQDYLFAKVYDSGSGDVKTQVNQGAFTAHVCLLGVERWRNYFSLQYNENEREKLIKRLPPDLLRELADAITERQEMTEEELRGLE
jgi:hypothetical protein